jgi:hypothetical protein
MWLGYIKIAIVPDYEQFIAGKFQTLAPGLGCP